MTGTVLPAIRKDGEKSKFDQIKHGLGHCGRAVTAVSESGLSLRGIEGSDGEPWFVGADVCRILGLSNPTMAVRALSPDEKTLSSIEGSRRTYNLVAEPGVYKLIQKSRRPEAVEFDRHVRHTILPAIRKDGGK